MNHSNHQIIVVLLVVFSSLQFQVSGVQAQCNGTWTLRTPADKPSDRAFHAMAYDSARGVTVLFGGLTEPAAVENAETWEWDGANWSQKSAVTSPSARYRHAMAYDSARGVTVLFGGYGNAGSLGDTWEWDGTNWSQISPAAAPLARINHGMAYDSARGVTVLFGGYDDNGDDDETWEWDGANWSQVSPATEPSAREYLAMAYDSARGTTLLFGGENAVKLGDTWEWDGTNWSQKIPAAPPSPRESHAMVYDSARAVTVLFGGFAGTARNADTWEWDGAIWAQRSPVPAPSARYQHKMAYDSGRRVIVLFGGNTLTGVAETWEWTGPTPAISQRPAALTVAPGQSAAFSIAADGLAPLTYRWRKDGAPLSDGGPIAGATTASLTINPTAESDSGQYDCLVTNPCGDTPSRRAALAVDPCIAIDPATDCNANGRVDSCDIAADPALDADANGTLDSCDSTACGACGAGVPMTLPLAVLGLIAVRQRRTSQYRNGRVSP